MTVLDRTLAETWRQIRRAGVVVGVLFVAGGVNVALLGGQWLLGAALWLLGAAYIHTGMVKPAPVTTVWEPATPRRELTWLEQVECGELADALEAWARHCCDVGVTAPVRGRWVADRMRCPECGGDEFGERRDGRVVCRGCWVVVTVTPAFMADVWAEVEGETARAKPSQREVDSVYARQVERLSRQVMASMTVPPPVIQKSWH